MLKEKMKQEKERETMERRGMNEHVKALKNELKASTEKLSKYIYILIIIYMFTPCTLEQNKNFKIKNERKWRS